MKKRKIASSFVCFLCTLFVARRSSASFVVFSVKVSVVCLALCTVDDRCRKCIWAHKSHAHNSIWFFFFYVFCDDTRLTSKNNVCLHCFATFAIRLIFHSSQLARRSSDTNAHREKHATHWHNQRSVALCTAVVLSIFRFTSKTLLAAIFCVSLSSLRFAFNFCFDCVTESLRRFFIQRWIQYQHTDRRVINCP